MKNKYIRYFISRKRSLVILLFFLSLPMYSQMDVQLNTYWQNPYYITPAYINDKQVTVFTLATRQQWVGFSGAPFTVFGSVSSYWDDIHTQVGIRVFNDKAGYTSVLDISGTYGYNLRLNDDWKTNLGVAFSYQSVDYDLTKITFEGTDESNVYSTLQSQKEVNADIGTEFYNPNFRIGIAARNLVSLFKKNPVHLNFNYLYGMYRQTTNNPVDFGGGISFIQYGNRFQGEVNATAFFKHEQDSEFFRTALFYRTFKELGAILSLNCTDWLNISYSYDYNFGISNHRLGHTHEIMISYRLDPKPAFRWDY